MPLGARGKDRDDSPGALGRGDAKQEGKLGAKAEDRTPDRYKMKEKIFDIGDDYWIETEKGRRAYKVDGKALHLRNTLILEDPRGQALYEIQSKVIAVKDKMAVTNPRGATQPSSNTLVSPLRDRMTANMADGADIDIRGNLLNHEYTMERRGKRGAEVSKRWITLRDTYTIEVSPGEDDALILALTVVVEQMCMD
ncbi:MAG: LURP-one-related family protein [Anaerolineales bacterium]|nr:LURP-one-related family protein [Anaerolineales bacterium]